MNPRMRMLVLAAFGILIALTILILLFSRGSQTAISGGSEGGNLFAPKPSVAPRVNIGDPQVQKKLEAIMREQTPILTDDVEIVYSPLIKKYFIHKKTANADTTIQDFFTRNEINGILYDPTMVQYVEEDALQYMLKEERRLFPDHPDTQQLDI